MRIVYAGTDEFSARVLEKLVAQFPVDAVLTQPARKRGRGQKHLPTPVAEKAAAAGLRVIELESFREKKDLLIGEFNQSNQALVVCSFGLYIPGWFTALFDAGTFNLHPSLVPKYRGAAPIQRALLNGDKETGVCIIEVASEMDAGDVYGCVRVSIDEDDNFATLSEKLIKAGSELLIDVLMKAQQGKVKKHPQTGDVVYAPKIEKHELKINWGETSIQVHNRVRAFSPKPGAWCEYRGKRIKVLKTSLCAEHSSEEGIPGEVIDIRDGIHVLTGDGCVKVSELKPENSRTLSAVEFINGYRLNKGDRFL